MQVRQEGKVMVVDVSADDLMDPVAVMSYFEQLIVEAGQSRILVNLSSIEYLSSLQIGTLVALHVLAYENVALLKFAGLNKKLEGLFNILGVNRVIEMHYGSVDPRDLFEEDPRPPRS